MIRLNSLQKAVSITGILLGSSFTTFAQTDNPVFDFHITTFFILMLILFILGITILVAAIYLKIRSRDVGNYQKDPGAQLTTEAINAYINSLTSNELDLLLQTNVAPIKPESGSAGLKSIYTLIAILISGIFYQPLFAQAQATNGKSIYGETGVIITFVLIFIPILAGIILMIIKLNNVVKQKRNIKKDNISEQFSSYLTTSTNPEIRVALQSRKEALNFKLSQSELAGTTPALDDKGLINNIEAEMILPLASKKKKASKRPSIDPKLSKLILWYLGCATFWLVLGTSVGEYLGIKFVAPDADHLSWLSFGRLRPVHTNMVFWGWASLGMLGLGFYIVPRVSNAPLANIKWGWYALILINISVIAGTLCLMAGINNGGGEYREYVWPVTLFFAAGAILTLVNFLKTIANRTTKEIYISNWYMIASLIFAIVITVVAYVPLWQDGLGETIIQGYYMHQGVGMWFMLFTLGIVYYLLPQQLNKPIYSYSLGILAFWAQIIFYTLIGTHHFIFSSIPWWLQTLAIVGSAGMIIPVAAGTANFLLTFKGSWYKLASSYTLPFYLVGIIFYFTGSMQGTAESFRSTNLIWHFTDFTVAHSHLTMYGIICFFLWAGIYTMVPRLTGKEAPQITIGAHFWLALIGLMFYTIPLMYGSTIKGIMAMQGKPFIDGVVFMQPYWLWRAIGGSLMWLSHLFFAYNMYKMLSHKPEVEPHEVSLMEEKIVVDNLN